jgi:hypothetical protein
MVEGVDKLSPVINLKTAKQLGIKISGIPARLRRQDHRIGDARLHAVSEWYLAIPPAVNSESLSGIYVRYSTTNTGTLPSARTSDV